MAKGICSLIYNLKCLLKMLSEWVVQTLATNWCLCPFHPVPPLFPFPFCLLHGCYYGSRWTLPFYRDNSDPHKCLMNYTTQEGRRIHGEEEQCSLIMPSSFAGALNCLPGKHWGRLLHLLAPPDASLASSLCVIPIIYHCSTSPNYAGQINWTEKADLLQGALFSNHALF